METRTWAIAGAGLLLCACAPTSGDSTAQSLTPTGSPRPAASTCDASSLGASGITPWTYSRAAERGEATGLTYVTVVVPVRVTLPCTGGDWQISMSGGGAQSVRVDHLGDAGPFGPYAVGSIITFRISWPQSAEALRAVTIRINGFDVPATVGTWPGADTTWSGPLLDSQTSTLPPPGISG